MLTDLLYQQVTLHRRTPGPPDEFGDPTELETDQPVMGLVQTRSNAEDPVDNARLSSLGVLYLEGKVDLTGVDAITDSDGTRWELDGDPEWQTNPRTRSIHHTRVGLARAYAERWHG